MTDRVSPSIRFKQHKASAKARGIAFDLTFEQWWSLWEPHWEKRGRGSFDMCMCRRHDQGAYTLGNVRIATNRENKHEQAMEAKVRHSQRRAPVKEYAKPMIGETVAWMRNHSVFDEYSENHLTQDNS